MLAKDHQPLPYPTQERAMTPTEKRVYIAAMRWFTQWQGTWLEPTVTELIKACAADAAAKRKGK